MSHSGSDHQQASASGWGALEGKEGSEVCKLLEITEQSYCRWRQMYVAARSWNTREKEARDTGRSPAHIDASRAH